MKTIIFFLYVLLINSFLKLYKILIPNNKYNLRPGRKEATIIKFVPSSKLSIFWGLKLLCELVAAVEQQPSVVDEFA